MEVIFLFNYRYLEKVLGIKLLIHTMYNINNKYIMY